MDATFSVAAYADDSFDRPQRGGRARAVSAERVVPIPVVAGSSGYAPRRNPVAIGVVAVAHLLGLWALSHFDVVALGRAKPQALAVTLVTVEPPPPPHEIARATSMVKVTTPVVAPPPLVALPVPSPPALIVAPPPPTPVLAAPAPAAAAPATEAPAGPSPVNLMADILDAPPPRFPVESRRLREAGTVRLRVTVSAEGRVSAVEVARSSGFDRLDEAAAAAVRRWRFRPRTVGGVAAEAIGFVPVTFNPPH